MHTVIGIMHIDAINDMDLTVVEGLEVAEFHMVVSRHIANSRGRSPSIRRAVHRLEDGRVSTF